MPKTLRNQNEDITSFLEFFSESIFKYFQVILSHWIVFNKHDIPGLYLNDLISCDFLQRFGLHIRTIFDAYDFQSPF